MTTGKNVSNSSDQDKKATSGNKSTAGKDAKDTSSHGIGSSSTSKSGNSGQHTADTSKSNKDKAEPTSSSTRGGTKEQHVEAGRQTHKMASN